MSGELIVVPYDPEWPAPHEMRELERINRL